MPESVLLAQEVLIRRYFHDAVGGGSKLNNWLKICYSEGKWKSTLKNQPRPLLKIMKLANWNFTRNSI